MISGNVIVGKLKLLTKTLSTKLCPGSIEYFAGRFYISGTGTRRVISRSSDILIIPITVANTTDETTVYTASVPAGSLEEGKMYMLEAFGKCSTHDAADSVVIKVKLNGTTIVTLASTPKQVTDVAMHLKAVLTIRSVGATGTVSSHVDVRIESTEIHTNISSSVINTTVVNDIIITFKWDNADLANTATIDQGYLVVRG